MNRDTIINKVFSRAFLGYDVEEVDSFLDEVIREFDRMRQELDVSRLRNKMLIDELERYRTAPAEEPMREEETPIEENAREEATPTEESTQEEATPTEENIENIQEETAPIEENTPSAQTDDAANEQSYE